jgi:hypothetical protein
MWQVCSTDVFLGGNINTGVMGSTGQAGRGRERKRRSLKRQIFTLSSGWKMCAGWPQNSRSKMVALLPRVMCSIVMMSFNTISVVHLNFQASYICPELTLEPFKMQIVSHNRGITPAGLNEL